MKQVILQLTRKLPVHGSFFVISIDFVHESFAVGVIENGRSP